MTKRTRKQSRRCFWSALGHRIHLRKFGYGDWFFVAVLFLLVVGTVNVFSSTFYMNLRSASGVTSDLSRHALFLALGAICGGLVYRFNYQNLRKSMTLWIGITVLMLLLVQVAGLTVNGARGRIYVSTVRSGETRRHYVHRFRSGAACRARRTGAALAVAGRRVGSRRKTAVETNEDLSCGMATAAMAVDI